MSATPEPHLDVDAYRHAGFSPTLVAPRIVKPARLRWTRDFGRIAGTRLAECLKWEVLWLGLALGTRHGAWQLGALAVYAEDLIPPVTAALGETLCAVQGLGLTIFVLPSPEQTGRRFRRRALEGPRESPRRGVLRGDSAHAILDRAAAHLGQPVPPRRRDRRASPRDGVRAG